ncbi:hypothetical protein [Polyangium spumosum]|uniref:Uncharacterized protein n=1 Tax=Polyangium spumosum TaxID=889282 RepID=A0A6N7PEH0_9BACT|nr:hypothetical protein [Polyangium spumosum]MRG90359.1 hypothetical protein [Polyangium spumosum]
MTAARAGGLLLSMARALSRRSCLLVLTLGGLAAGCGPAPTRPSDPATASPRPSSLPVAAPPTASASPPATRACPGALATATPDLGWFPLGASAPSSSAAPAPSPGVVSPSTGGFPSAVYDAEGRLVVAWTEAPGVRLRRFEGGRFQDLPPITTRTVDGFAAPMVTRDSAGRVLVYFLEDTRPRVFRVEANNVVDLSPKSPPPARFFGVRGIPRIVTCLAMIVPVAPSRLVVDGEGRPLVGWAEAGPHSMRAVVHRWTGSAWTTLSIPDIGPIDHCAPNAKTITLAADPKGQPYVAFRKDDAITVMAWNGSGFRQESRRVPDRDAATTSEPWITFGPKNVRWKAWTERVREGGKLREHVQVVRSDAKGSRVLKQPAGRPLRGQIVAFGGGERPRIAVLDTNDDRAELRFVAWDDDAPVELTGGPGAADFTYGRRHSFPSAALPEGAAPPAVVYRGGTEIAARVWEAGGYRAPGGAPAAKDGLGRGVAEGIPPVIAMRGGRVAVAWLMPGAFPTIITRRWTGCRWETAPALPVLEAGRPGPGLRPAISIDAEGRVLLVYSTGGAGAMVVTRWAGASWELWHVPREGSAPAGPRSPTALAFGVEVDAAGTPVVAWADRTRQALGLSRHLGQGYGQGFRLISSDPAPISITPAMTTDDAGRPVVAMLDLKPHSGFVGYTRRLDGDRFVEVPPWTSAPMPNNGFPPEHFDLAAGPDGALALAFRWSSVDAPYVALWNGSSWNTISSPGTTAAPGDAPGPGGSPAITFDEAGGLRVAYADRASGEVLVKRFVGGAWAQDEPGGTPNDSVSRSEAASVDPVIASSGGAVCVAWTERAGDDGRVLLRCRK